MCAILDLVAAQGADAVSAQAVADAVGITQPAVFRHFATTEAMWLAVMDWLEQRLAEVSLIAEPAMSDPALAGLRRMFYGHVRLIERHPAVAKLVFADHLRLRYPALQQRFALLHQGYKARLLAALEHAKSEGELALGISADAAVTMFLCMVQGLAFQFAIARFPMSVRREAQRLFDLYARAVGA